jgi:hypothetical protein
MEPQVDPLLLCCHCTAGNGESLTDEVRVTDLPSQTDCDCGCVVMLGGKILDVMGNNLAESYVVSPAASVTDKRISQ